MVNIKKNIRKMKKQLKRDFLTLPVIRTVTPFLYESDMTRRQTLQR